MVVVDGGVVAWIRGWEGDEAGYVEVVWIGGVESWGERSGRFGGCLLRLGGCCFFVPSLFFWWVFIRSVAGLIARACGSHSFATVESGRVAVLERFSKLPWHTHVLGFPLCSF